jgi:hypothetical protein
VLVHGVEPPGGMGEEFQAHQRALTEIGRTAVTHAVEEAEQAGVATFVEVLSEKPASCCTCPTSPCSACPRDRPARDHRRVVHPRGVSGSHPPMIAAA